MFTESLVPVGDLRLNVATGPRNGPPLWLVHGLIRRWQDFGPILPDLAARWTVRAPDHRGHGRSDRAASYLVTDYLGDIAALVQDESEPAVIVGHSLGALVALGVAAARPDKVRAVVLLDPPGTTFVSHIAETPYAAVWAGIRALAGRGSSVAELARRLGALRVPDATRPGQTTTYGSTRDAATVRFVARCVADIDPATLNPAVEGGWLEGFDLAPQLGRVRCPVLLLVGDPKAGGMLPPADADPLAAALTDCTRVDLQGVGHLPHTQDPAATLKLLHAFLDSL
ncbi:alpha/beta fold hydrolase [Urbifossiella limnaea]|uniref:Pimeloyl-[acyl-carrier protein] methyl ester esterase n=1 Tax=Urbifossiella limnaea TaxID=2528023 RepID=A0A517XSG4_9BACT|nr:alpha/beta hydrolase [Urbifossiella limnaea]QDU20454.1 Pimeloyl-[acyl-carrier protein] methyl ester esterase [Urbifossiella limnaea]